MIVCLHGAGVGTFIIDIHIVYLDAVLGLGVGEDDHTVVYRPLVIAGIQDGAAVQPRYPCYPVINSTSAKEETRWSQTWNRSHSEHPHSQKPDMSATGAPHHVQAWRWHTPWPCYPVPMSHITTETAGPPKNHLFLSYRAGEPEPKILFA